MAGTKINLPERLGWQVRHVEDDLPPASMGGLSVVHTYNTVVTWLLNATDRQDWRLAMVCRGDVVDPVVRDLSAPEAVRLVQSYNRSLKED